MLVVIDNYDSFTYNLVHYLGELGGKTVVYRNDAISAAEVLDLQPDGIVLSPGPCDPDRAGICLELIAAARSRVPLLGVCLGHQAIGQSFGGRVIRAPELMHGKLSDISHSGQGILAGVPSPFRATRYHSLVVERATLPDELVVTAHTASGLIMALQHKTLPIYGVQFHPESIATEHGHRLLDNFLSVVYRRNAAA